MKMHIWYGVDPITDNYHTGGGLMIIAEDLEAAREFWKSYCNRENTAETCAEFLGPEYVQYCTNIFGEWLSGEGRPFNDTAIEEIDPDAVFDFRKTDDEIKPQIFIFPNKGCC